MGLYQPVKYALMIILLIGLVITIMELAPEMQKQKSNSNDVVVLTVQLIVLIIGFLGAYRGNRQLLLTFAIIAAIVLIVSVVQSQKIAVVGNAALHIICIALAVWQSEMLRTGDII